MSYQGALKRFFLTLALTVVLAAPGLADSHSYDLYVDGLACPFCAYGVEKQLSGLENVKSVDIQIDQGIVAVTMAPGTTLDEARARQAVSDAGFTLRKFKGLKKP